MGLEQLRRLTEQLVGATTDCVLVVDDEPNQVKTLAGVLGAMSLRYETASTAKGAIAAAAKHKPLVAVVDLNLSAPGEGWRVIEGIREVSPATRCVILTGYASRASAIRAVNLGIYGYVEKPGVEQLLEMICKVLGVAEG